MNFWLLLRAGFVLFAATLVLPLPGETGRILDTETGRPIQGAVVTSGGTSVLTDSDGRFTITAEGGPVRARAAGYRASGAGSGAKGNDIRLTPFSPRALYLSYYGVSSRTLRDGALDVMRRNPLLNALVIDVKGDRGLISLPTSIALAHQIGTDKSPTIPDPPALVKQLHDAGIYLIARIVVFKDLPLAGARPDLAVKTSGGALFHDRENLSWTDAFQREVWNYNIDIAVEAARAGFDEIQFDYLRFPDTEGLRFSQPNNLRNRTSAIDGFLTEARRRLTPYNTFLAADIFGYVCWNTDDTGIGQKLEEIVPLVDYISPMLYPSGFTFGIPGYHNPVEHPYEIVRLSLDRARMRTGISPRHFRPWLQAFKDYAFDRRTFDANEMEPQIEAAEAFGSAGWMIWNPRNVYTGIGF